MTNLVNQNDHNSFFSFLLFMFRTFHSAVINFSTNLKSQFLYISDYSSVAQINAITVKYLVDIIVKFPLLSVKSIDLSTQTCTYNGSRAQHLLRL